MNPHLSDWLRILYCGDYEKFSGFLSDLSEEGVKILLSKRETMYNVPAVFHVIRGAGDLFSEDPILQDHQDFLRQNLEVKDGHMKILIKLLSLGVDVNARDVGGRTPLHLVGGHNEVTLKMAARLIRAGADVNAKDRRGETPLHYGAFSSYIEFVKLLLANGADPDIKDNDGDTVYDLSPPSIKDILGEFEKKRAAEERKLSREAVGGSFRQCGVCKVGVGEKIMKRCSGRKLLFILHQLDILIIQVVTLSGIVAESANWGIGPSTKRIVR